MTIEIHHIKGSGFFDVDSVDAHKGIYYRLTAIGSDGITERVGNYINRHSFVNSNAISDFVLLNGYAIEHFIISIPLNPDRYNTSTKKRRIHTVTRPAAKGLRIARQSGTSNAEPTPYDILFTKGAAPLRYNPMGTSIIPEDIYSCFILDFVKEVAKFLAAKNQAQ